ncbi:MAG: succinate dehydrogenase [Candidatus Limnocylindrales bacterium]
MSVRTGIPDRRVRGADAARPGTRRRGVVGWVDVRGRRLGGWAFILNRLAGLGVLFYLYLHLLVLSQLAVGPDAWNSLLQHWFLNPVFLALDVVLLAGLLLHGLNGIRLALVEFGLVVSRQKALLVALTVIGAIVLLIGVLMLISHGG